MKCVFEKKCSLMAGRGHELYILQSLLLLCSLCIQREFMFLALDFTLFYLLETSCSFLQILFIRIGNIHFIFMCRLCFVLDLECMSYPCCFESFFASGESCFLLHVDFFSAWQERLVLRFLVCFKEKFQFSLSFDLFASVVE